MLLLATDRPSFGKNLATRLQQSGIYLFRSSLETTRFLCREKDTGGVILDAVTDLKACERIAGELRAEYPEIPIALIVLPRAVPNADVDCIIRETDPDAIFSAALEFAVKGCGFRTSALSTFYFFVGERKEDVLYKGYRLSLSQKEYELLRILFYRAPRPTSPEDLLDLLYPAGGRKLSSLYTLVSSIHLPSFSAMAALTFFLETSL